MLLDCATTTPDWADMVADCDEIVLDRDEIGRSLRRGLRVFRRRGLPIESRWSGTARTATPEREDNAFACDEMEEPWDEITVSCDDTIESWEERLT